MRKRNPEAVGLRRGWYPFRRGSQIAAVTFPEGWAVNRIYRTVPAGERKRLALAFVQADFAIGSVPRGSQISSTRDTARLETSDHVTSARTQRA